MTTSPIERAVAAVGPERFLSSLNVQEQQALAFQWRLWARPSQLPPPGEWLTWLPALTEKEFMAQVVELVHLRHLLWHATDPCDQTLTAGRRGEFVQPFLQTARI